MICQESSQPLRGDKHPPPSIFRLFRPAPHSLQFKACSPSSNGLGLEGLTPSEKSGLSINHLSTVIFLLQSFILRNMWLLLRAPDGVLGPSLRRAALGRAWGCTWGTWAPLCSRHLRANPAAWRRGFAPAAAVCPRAAPVHCPAVALRAEKFLPVQNSGLSDSLRRVCAPVGDPPVRRPQ